MSFQNIDYISKKFNILIENTTHFQDILWKNKTYFLNICGDF